MADKSYQVFRTEKKGQVFWITMDNPCKRNALGAEFWKELPQVFEEADKDMDTRVIVLAAAGQSFCAGLDLMALSAELPMLISGEAGGRAKRKFLEVIREFQKITSLPESCRKPVIAAVQGHCIGGGLDLIASCDIRLATEDASFSLREAAVAMIADLGSLQRLSGIVGEGVLREMAYTAGNIPAERALILNLVNEVYPDLENLWEAAQHMAELIAANSPIAVETTKEVLNYSRKRTVEEGLEYAAVRQSMLLPNPDLMEAITAFAERRKPEFGKDA